jgi:hypothetical protein
VDSSFRKLPKKQKSCAAHRCGLHGAAAQGISATKGGVNMDIKEMKKDILEYDLYYVVDGVPYGDYLLSIFNEGDKVTILVEDAEGSAAWVMDREEFLNISTTEELEKHINNILYYNYIEYEGE